MNTAPQSQEAEEQVIGACMIDGVSVISKCVQAGIGPQSFTTGARGLIFATMLELVRRGVPVDAGTVTEEITARGQLASVGGYAAICQASSNTPTTAQASFYIERVATLAKQRKLIDALTEGLESARAPVPRWADLWDGVAPHLHAAQDAGADGQRRSIADVAANAARWRLTPDSRPVAPTCWAGWDRLAGIPKAGELIVVAGRPGTGKSTLAGNIAHDTASAGRTVAFFSLEMSSEELVDRFAIRRAGRDGIGHDRNANAAVVAEIERIGREKTLHIYEASDAGSVAQIEATCRLLAAAPAGLGCVVVDYLQLVSPPAESKREPREQQVAAMSRRFKLMARAINCPVFLLAQLNRESEREDRRPRLSDLRESGAIEQDADRVWFLYRPRTNPSDAPQAEDAAEIPVALYQAKCRNGPGGIEAVMRFHRPIFTFAP